MLQNATFLRKSAPGPPNVSDEHVSCTAPTTENVCLQVLFKCPTPAIVFGHATRPSRFCQLLTRCTIPCACHAKRHLNVQKCPYTFDLEMCFAPQRRALFPHLNFQTCSNTEVLCAFWLGNVLRATTTCNLSSLIWPHGSAPAGEPTFRPSGATNHWKNTVFRDFATFSQTWIFFLLRLSIFWYSFFFSSLLFSFLLFSSLLWLFPSLLFICPYCRKFGF